MVFLDLHVILSYLTASIFRDPMLNCFWNEFCSFYFTVTSSGSVNNAILGIRLPKSSQLSIFYLLQSHCRNYGEHTGLAALNSELSKLSP